MMEKKSLFIILALFFAFVSFAQETSIVSGDLSLKLVSSDGTYTPRISFKGVGFVTEDDCPVVLHIYGESTVQPKTYAIDYSNISKKGKTLVCNSLITTEAGSRFLITDNYSVDYKEENTLRLDREVSIAESASADHAFNSLFILHRDETASVGDYDFFIPGVIYKNGDNKGTNSIGEVLSDEWILAREDRLPLPQTMLMSHSDGISLSITDYNLDPATVAEDEGRPMVVSAGMRFGSLGFRTKGTAPALVYCYPGAEGEHTLVSGASNEQRRWAWRSHPVQTSVVHNYTLLIHAASETGFPASMEAHYRFGFDAYDPQLLDISNDEVLRLGIEVLDKNWMKTRGAPGFPFSTFLNTGEVNGIVSYCAGFVGMQPACGYYLYRYGLETGDNVCKLKGEQLLDFWATKSPMPSGLPRIFYSHVNHDFIDYDGGGTQYNDLRNMQGGLEAMIEAWMTAEKNEPGRKGSWLRYCRNAADWLVLKQNGDGSFAKSYSSDGTVYDKGKMLTPCLVRFLTQMYAVTHIKKYKTAALKAGNFCLKQIHIPYCYMGCVIDQSYVIDRESGQKMVEAALCLYDLTGEEQWIDVARQAAYYCMSYCYVWNIPPQPGKPMPISSDKTTVGLTLITTSHSGGDCGMAYNSFEFFRLYVLTGDPYLLRFAQILEKNTKHTMDFDGKLGYAYRGYQTEAWGMRIPRGSGVNIWLPWLTATSLDPLMRMKDAYGVLEIEQAAALPLEELQRLDAAYGATQGLK